ncbi:Ig-like domain-containing protein [Neobacillus sp. NPDC097160]|uniref:Ig-like domain-containing protein n=1 Tax=Neobacillus sp. NPDC097160 TaxID=3364298 RepID=UPI0038203B4B
MKKAISRLILITALILSSFTVPAYGQEAGKPTNTTTENKVQYEGERRINFNGNWRFQRETSGSIAGAQNPAFDDSSWRQLNLPHDWSIELDFNKASLATHEGGYLDGGIGWYRKTFTVPESMKGKRISIDFDGVYMNSTTYLNGQMLGTYPFGYNAFSYDITDKLYTDGRENVLVVKVNNTQPSSRWYSGSGIYRNVYLTVTNPIHVARYGTFVTTPNLETTFAAGRADVNIKTKVSNESGEARNVKVKSTIYDDAGKAVSTVESEEKTAAAGATANFEDNTIIEQPKLWSIDNPYRYKLVTEVMVGGQTVDTYETRFGARYFKFDENEGFSLNGKYMKLHGVSMHHDLGALGAATNARAVERQMQIMKEMGVNAIRVTHNPASPELLEAANNLGLFIVEEAFDSWAQSKKTYDYGRFFTTWAEHDIKEMVDRGKNEPAIIMWSIGNEIYDTTNAAGVETARNLVRWVKEIDTTRPTTIGEDKTRGDKVNVTPINSYIKEIFNIVDIVGLNYSENNYAGYHQQNPNWKLYGSETSSATRSRGVYTHPYQYNQSTKYADLQQSSYDNDYVGWGRTAEDAWKYDRDYKHIAGQFIWTGFDYVGEPTPYYNAYPAKSSYFGAVDTAGFPKDIFYYYQSQWKNEPMVHLLPHWNWSEGETVRVLAYTNAFKVELFLNGESLGERSYENKQTSWGAPYKETKDGKTYLEWAVPFKAGKLEAVAKDESGKEIARDQVVTAGEPAAVRLTADKKVITADGTDLSFITAEIVDNKGNDVPNADHLIKFDVSGQGELAGVDNGNASSVERYKDTKRKAFSGKAVAIIQSNKLAGEITINASVAGLSSDTTSLFTVSPADREKKTVVGMDAVNVTVNVNEAPKLPSEMKVYYSDATADTKNVTWDAIDPKRYSTIGKFTVAGSVDGTSLKAKAVVTVKGIVAVKPVSTATKVGVRPVLPEKVTLLYSDETTMDVDVTWTEIAEDKLTKEGRFVVEGSVEETDLKAQAYVRATNESKSVNIMLPAQGSSYPELEATFTNPADNLQHLNDGIKSYTNSPVNRWTNWTRTPRDDGDSITVNFGKEHVINNLDLFVFTDSGTVVPEKAAVQYWDGAAWKDVENLTQPSQYAVEKNEIRFDAVSTDKLKFHLTPSVKGKFLALTEAEVYADQIVMSPTAELSGITVNGKALAGFAAAKKNYELVLPYGTALPKIEAAAADNATVTILPAFSYPGTAKLFVTSEDGKVTSENSIQVSMEEPKLISAELSVGKTNIVEDDMVDLKVKGLLESKEIVDLTDIQPTYEFDKNIIRIEGNKLYALEAGEVKVKATVKYKGVTVTTPEVTCKIAKNPTPKNIESLEPVTVMVEKGEAPKLPETVVAHYNRGIPREVNVKWDRINPSLYQKLGEFTVSGNVEGTNIKAQAKVVVKGAVAIEDVTMAVLLKQVPELPEEVTVFYSNGTEEHAEVKWEEIPRDELRNVGEFKVKGSVKGVNLKATATIRVTDEVGGEQNISRAKNGYEYPKAEASFTNNGPGSSDRIEAINDDVISYDTEPHNRWTNWQPKPRAGDWVSITFGDYEPTEYDVDKMEIHWFADSGTSYPASFKIQYKSGDSWKDVTNLKSDPASPELGKANVSTFDKVKTSAIRVEMTAQSGKSLAITEIKVFSKWPKASTEPKVSDIKIGGKSVLDDFEQKGDDYDLTIDVDDAKDLQKIKAKAEGNTSITVVPVVSAPSTAKIIAKSEDGKKVKVYYIHYK